jgi:hypothetical protein
MYLRRDVFGDLLNISKVDNNKYFWQTLHVDIDAFFYNFLLDMLYTSCLFDKECTIGSKTYFRIEPLPCIRNLLLLTNQCSV